MKQKYFDPNNFKVNKTCRMGFRATQQEQITIQAKAQACGKSVSSYIRQCALGHKPKLRRPDPHQERPKCDEPGRPRPLLHRPLFHEEMDFRREQTYQALERD